MFALSDRDDCSAANHTRPNSTFNIASPDVTWKSTENRQYPISVITYDSIHITSTPIQLSTQSISHLENPLVSPRNFTQKSALLLPTYSRINGHVITNVITHVSTHVITHVITRARQPWRHSQTRNQITIKCLYPVQRSMASRIQALEQPCKIPVPASTQSN